MNLALSRLVEIVAKGKPELEASSTLPSGNLARAPQAGSASGTTTRSQASAQGSVTGRPLCQPSAPATWRSEPNLPSSASVTASRPWGACGLRAVAAAHDQGFIVNVAQQRDHGLVAGVVKQFFQRACAKHHEAPRDMAEGGLPDNCLEEEMSNVRPVSY
jgi:hypothetical protein